MRKIDWATLATGTVLLGTLATAAPASDTKPEEKQTALVCKAEETTGSILGRKRVCKTRAEWRNITAEGRYNIDKVMSRTGVDLDRKNP